MTDFKAGDKVRVANIYGGTSDNRVGAEGTIKAVRDSGGAFNVQVENKGHSRFGQELVFYPSELELVKPEPKFKVGDWVKVHGRNDKWDGTVGTVQEVGNKGFGSYDTLYTVHKDDAAGAENVLQFFERVLEATEAPSKFQVGDRVAPTQTAVSEHKGQPGIIKAVNPKSLWPFKVGYSDGTDEIFRADEIEIAPKFATGGYLPNYAAADVKFTQAIFGKINGDKPEAVKHPAHYGGDTTYEAIKVIEAWGLGFNLGNAAKYLARAGKKGNKVEDLNKLIQYVQFEIAKEEAK